MSRARPIYFVDLHPDYQAGFDFELAARQGVRGAIIKFGQGGQWVPTRLKEFVAASRRHFDWTGGYYWPDETRSGESQSRHFLDLAGRFGGHRGLLLANDFEPYKGEGWDYSCSNGTLRDFGRHFKANTDGHPLIGYSNASYWNSGNPSGDAKQYGIDVAWKANVHRSEEDIKRFRLFYAFMRARYGWKYGAFGGLVPMFWQYTWGARIGGLNVDLNAFRGTPEQLDRLAMVRR